MASPPTLPTTVTPVQQQEAMLDFYRKLRRRIAASRVRFNGLPAGSGPWKTLIAGLALLPDLFHLGVRLVLDPQVPTENKGALLAVLIYVMSPIDLIPDAIPVSGWVDDLVVLVIGLNKFLEIDNPEVRAAIGRHWAGAGEVIGVIKHLLSIADEAIEFLPKKLMRMMKDIFRG
ncbi:MAG: DUF1232 domain-containing protein [Methylococcaceae bacterium]|nr:DUF1232 domain-containing protein [Methylococcaceae bacterium]